MLDFVNLIAVNQPNFHLLGDTAFHHAHENDGAAVHVEPRIENQRLQRIFRAAFGRRHASDDGFENLFDAESAFCADQQGVLRRNREHGFDLFFCEIRLCGGQIDLIDHRQNRQVVARCEKGICHRLGFHALARIDHQQRAFARREGARNFIRKIHVSGRIDQI